MAKNGCSNFFPTIFPKKTGINSEWPKMAVTIFFQPFFPKRLVQIWNGQKWPFQIFSNNFSQEDWYKFRMAKNNHFKFFPTIFPKKTGTNSEWPKCAFQNYSDLFGTKRLEEIWNGQKWAF